MGVMGLKFSRSSSTVNDPSCGQGSKSLSRTVTQIEDVKHVPEPNKEFMVHVQAFDSVEDTKNVHGVCFPGDLQLPSSQQDDALFSAYQEYMADSMAQGISQHLNTPIEKSSSPMDISDLYPLPQKDSESRSSEVETLPRARKAPEMQLPFKINSNVGLSYVESMKKVLDMKKQDVIGLQGQKKKATGVTRRLMEEVHIAKENMFLYQRLASMSPSQDISRKYHKKEFRKSRHLLDKMSRFEYQQHRFQEPSREVKWVD